MEPESPTPELQANRLSELGYMLLALITLPIAAAGVR